jgi:hypothetical protein
VAPDLTLLPHVGLVACPSIHWHPWRVSFPNAWQSFLIFRLLDILSLGIWMMMTEINGFNIFLQDRDGGATSGIVSPWMHVWYALGDAMLVLGREF